MPLPASSYCQRPSDADSTCGIDLLLSNELLKEVLSTGWEQQQPGTNCSCVTDTFTS